MLNKGWKGSPSHFQFLCSFVAHPFICSTRRPHHKCCLWPQRFLVPFPYCGIGHSPSWVPQADCSQVRISAVLYLLTPSISPEQGGSSPSPAAWLSSPANRASPFAWDRAFSSRSYSSTWSRGEKQAFRARSKGKSFLFKLNHSVQTMHLDFCTCTGEAQRCRYLLFDLSHV